MGKDMPDTMPCCCVDLDLKPFKGLASASENRWLSVFQPRMIPPGCCCSSSTQLYVITPNDLVRFCETMQEAIPVLKRGPDHEEYERFKMDENVQKAFMMNFMLPT